MIVTLLGMGLVGNEFLRLVDKDPDVGVPLIGVRDIEGREWGDAIFSSELNDLINNEGVDVVVEAMSDTDASVRAIKYAIAKKKNVISCSKDVWTLYKEELAELAQEAGVKIMLNSLVATAAKKPALDYELNEQTIAETDNKEIGKFRKADAEITAKAMYEDLKTLNSGIEGGNE